jgi:hypothetical protein
VEFKGGSLKRNILIVYVLLCIASWLQSATWHIRQDGTGDFTTIQEGINTSADADTVLVYPGIYYEYIDYNAKNITVTSLFLISGDEQYISQTIIDGSNTTRCVRIEDSHNIALVGLTIQNGYAVNTSTSGWGGGLLIMEVEYGLVSNCRITNNTSELGGGCVIYASNITLSANTISYNQSTSGGGGLSIVDSYTSIIEFDPINLNNIYFNYSSSGTEIYIASSPNTYTVIVDTFTVAEFDEYFIAPFKCEAGLSAQHHKIEQIDQDLYVAPEGNDENSGLTADDPLQTIAWDQMLIRRNDNDPHTIHLAPGTYSPSLNDQKFPLGIKHGVTIQGESPENTILDGDDQFNIIKYGYYNSAELPSLIVKNLTMTNARNILDAYGAINILKANLALDNVIISNNCYGEISSAILCRDGIYDFNNVIISDNIGGYAVIISCIHAGNPEPMLLVNIKNSVIQNNYPSTDPTSGYGGGINIAGHLNIPGDYYASLINCDISSNYSSFENEGVAGTAGYHPLYNIRTDIVNCTFGDNAVNDTSGCVITGSTNAQVNIFNSIIYDNIGHSCNLWFEAEFNVYNSLLQGGPDNVGYYYPVNASFNWHDGNLDEDPLWLATGEYPYTLQSGSPCIDAGTLNLPAGIELPSFDLAGNPRIFGETIDMGAYEWQGNEISDHNLPATKTNLTNYPNPFNSTTSIKLEIVEAGVIELAVYNIKGQKVKTLMDCTTVAGVYRCEWNGKDEQDKSVSSGQYIIKLQQNGKDTAKKMLFLK